MQFWGLIYYQTKVNGPTGGLTLGLYFVLDIQPRSETLENNRLFWDKNNLFYGL